MWLAFASTFTFNSSVHNAQTGQKKNQSFSSMFDTRYRCLFIYSTRWQVEFPSKFEAWLDYTPKMIVCVHESKCGHELNCAEHVMCGRAKHRLNLLYTRCCYNSQQFVSVNIRRLSKCCWRNGFVSASGSCSYLLLLLLQQSNEIRVGFLHFARCMYTFAYAHSIPLSLPLPRHFPFMWAQRSSEKRRKWKICVCAVCAGELYDLCKQVANAWKIFDFESFHSTNSVQIAHFNAIRRL